MHYLFFGLIALVILLLAARAFVSADPRMMAVIIRRSAGALALLFATLLVITGRWFIALPVAAFGLSLLMGRGLPFRGFPGATAGDGARRSGQPGRTSSVKTVFLDMALDHDTGQMNGRVLAGAYDGQLLSDLDYVDLMTLRDECRSDPQSLALLETYLDRVHPDWRTDWHDEETETSREERARQGGGPMTRDEARAILGVDVGADAEDIRRAHRQLMKRFHPDHGGSDYLAAKINEAKDTLLADT